MKVVIAPDSFKGSLNALEVAKLIEQTLHLHFPNAEYILVPLADGGEGTLNCLLSNIGGTREKVVVADPLGRPIEAEYGILSDGKTVVIETAEASGITRLKTSELNVQEANTYGTGELILAALNKGFRKFIIGLGGSATCDGGIGALAALGAKFKNIASKDLPPIARSLPLVHEIDLKGLDARLKESEFTLAYDVDNPLIGLYGALMYAPQKGATPTDLELLHKGYEQWNYILQQKTGEKIGEQKGSGAAGGLGASLAAFLPAKWISGSELMIEKTNLLEKLKEATLVITGEGRIDAQTLHGKIPLAVAKAAKSQSGKETPFIPVIAITGSVQEGFENVYAEGIDAVFCLPNGPLTKEECLLLVKPLLINIINNIARLLKLRIFL